MKMGPGQDYSFSPDSPGELALQPRLPMPGPAGVIRCGLISIKDVLSILFRHKIFILVVFELSLLSALLITLITPKAFESEMKLFVKNERADVVVTPQQTDRYEFHGDVGETQVNSEIQFLGSQDLLEEVVRKCSLGRDDSKAETDRALNVLQKNLVIAPVRNSNVIRVSYLSSSPERAAFVLQTLEESFLEKRLNIHRTSGAYKFFAEQAKYYAKELDRANAALVAFQQRTNGIAMAEQKAQALQKFGEAESALRAVEASLNESRNRGSEIKAQLATVERRIRTQSRSVPNQFFTERTNSLLVELQNRRTQLLTRLQPEERAVKELDKQIADTQAALKKASGMNALEEATDVNPVYQTLTAEAAKNRLDEAGLSARAQVLALQARRYREEFSRLGTITAEHDSLLRAVNEAKENSLLYAEKREQARVANALDQRRFSNIAIVQAPTIPQAPSRPKMALNLILGLLLAGFISTAGVAISEIFRQTIFTPKELEALVSVPVVATVPRINVVVGVPR